MSKKFTESCLSAWWCHSVSTCSFNNLWWRLLGLLHVGFRQRFCSSILLTRFSSHWLQHCLWKAAELWKQKGMWKWTKKMHIFFTIFVLILGYHFQKWDKNENWKWTENGWKITTVNDPILQKWSFFGLFLTHLKVHFWTMAEKWRENGQKMATMNPNGS